MYIRREVQYVINADNFSSLVMRMNREAQLVLAIYSVGEGVNRNVGKISIVVDYHRTGGGPCRRLQLCVQISLSDISGSKLR